MRIFRDIPVAIVSLRSNPLRTFLTLLGIAVGIGAVMYVVMLGEVSQARIKARLDALGANVLIVRPGNSRMRRVSQAGAWQNLTRKDAEDILAASKVITELVPEFSGSGQVEFQDKNHQTRITGTTPRYEMINKHLPAVGRWFRDSEADRSARVAVLGADVVKELFPSSEALGQTITINDVRFEVIGVLQSKGGGWSNPDDQVFVPLATAQQRLFGADHITTMYVQVDDGDAIEEAFFDVESVLRRNHRLRPDQDNDFRIRKQDVFLSTVQETNKEVARLILLIAMVSLIVGGIGIANVMLISIVERTREIGVRRAIGAQRRDILGQFLVEAGVLGVFGGILGLIGGSIVNKIAFPPVASVPVQWFGYSFLICCSVGLISGLYPAIRAAHLNVIEAIRHE